jgi:hypothetical protein
LGDFFYPDLMEEDARNTCFSVVFCHTFREINLQVDPQTLWKGQLIRRHRFPAADGGDLKSEENNLRWPAEW